MMTKDLLPMVFFVTLAIKGNSPQETQAYAAVSQAMYHELELDKYFQRFIDQNVSDETKNLVGKGVFLVDIATKQRITMTWSFE
jgi:hypothetical protein